ncbi:interleukin-23 receptor isoform X2 [Anabas testudineus]|uniref:interleukin-23 receptor isoform X2 n=1 Tax=Anabas testudineus TaxID=64144 RepID=UPI000E4589AA|nr:interleukin-23 receptor isoform X2 [Anabas testudineus]
MNPPSIIWRCIITLLIFSVKCCPLLPASSQRFNGRGYLTVEPAPLFLIGSNLTVYCHINTCQSSFKISLELNGEIVKSWRKVNCTTVIFDLLNVQKPQSILLCKQEKDEHSLIVNGLDLRGGLPPGKPDSIVCETTRSSDSIACTWKIEQETHLSNTYNVSVSRENGTQIHFDQIQDAEQITIPRGILDENINYQLIVTVYNHFGALHSDPFILCVKDIVMPEVPRIMQVEFENSSIVAVLRWNTTESSVHVRPYIRLRTDNGLWEVREGTELSKDLIRVGGLRPLTEYQFQIRACKSASVFMHTNTTPSFTLASTSTSKSFCSKWSLSVRRRSPGKGPSQQLCVWRMLGNHWANGLRDVTVLWKPPPLEDYSGKVQHYMIFPPNGLKQDVICAATMNRCAVQVPAEIQALSISVVTSYGISPPAHVPLRHSGGFVPVLRDLAPAANGSAVLVSWLWAGTKQQSTSGEELLHYVVEWTDVPASQLQWHTVAKDQHNTSITGLTSGVRYNISLYAVTTRGVSAPSSRLAYSKEQKPVSGPSMSVLVHKTRQILIQWDELPVHQHRGFITNYTIYVQTLDYSSTELSVTLFASGPRKIWIDCPEGALALQVTASTSAGEGPRTNQIYSQPEAPAVGLVIVIALILTLFIAIIANLMCWSCVRKRIKQKCISWGPAWLVENLPKPGNSNAIRLLEDGSEPSFSCTHSDPPLSPISLISWEERDDVYPTIHVETSQFDSGQPTVETPLLKSDCGTMLVGQLEHVSYKPQIATLGSQVEEVKDMEEEQRDMSESGDEDRCSGVFRGLLGGLLSSVEVDFSDSPLGPTLSSVGGLSWPNTSPVLNRGVVLGSRSVENDAEEDSPCVRLQQEEITTPDMSEPCTSLCTVGTTLPYGYFPQLADVSSTKE